MVFDQDDVAVATDEGVRVVDPVDLGGQPRSNGSWADLGRDAKTRAGGGSHATTTRVAGNSHGGLCAWKFSF